MTAPLPPIRSLISQHTDAPKIGGGYEVYVDPVVGDDASGLRNRREYPFRTLSAAAAAGQAGDTVRVNSGAHALTNPATWNLARNLLNWSFAAGVSITCTAVLTNANPVPGIFDDGGAAMAFNVTGDAVITMSITESSPNVANHIDVYAISITAASTVRIQCRSIFCDTALRNGVFTAHTGHSIRQTGAATLILDIEDPNDITISAGTARITTRGTNTAVTTSGSAIVDVLGSVVSSITISGGNVRATCDYLGSLSASGGTARAAAQRIDAITHSAANVYVEAQHVGSLSRTGSSGTGYYTVSVWGDGTTESINISQSGTAKTYFFGGVLDSTAAPCVTFAGGIIRVRDMEVRCTAPTGSHGTDIAIGVGDVAGVNATDLTMTDMLVRVNDSTHSCWRVYSESPFGSTYRVTGGTYQAGATGFWFDPEAARTVNVQGEVTTNRPAGPFATLGGSGTIVTDPALSL